jgi:hypothetical protein
MFIQEREDRLDPLGEGLGRRIEGVQVEARHGESWKDSDQATAGEIL